MAAGERFCVAIAHEPRTPHFSARQLNQRALYQLYMAPWHAGHVPRSVEKLFGTDGCKGYGAHYPARGCRTWKAVVVGRV